MQRILQKEVCLTSVHATTRHSPNGFFTMQLVPDSDSGGRQCSNGSVENRVHPYRATGSRKLFLEFYRRTENYLQNTRRPS
jgi:hypothetical protein